VLRSRIRQITRAQAAAEIHHKETLKGWRVFWGWRTGITLSLLSHLVVLAIGSLQPVAYFPSLPQANQQTWQIVVAPGYRFASHNGWVAGEDHRDERYARHWLHSHSSTACRREALWRSSISLQLFSHFSAGCSPGKQPIHWLKACIFRALRKEIGKLRKRYQRERREESAIHYL